MLIQKEKYKKTTLVAAAVLAAMTLSACNDSNDSTTAARSSSKPKNIILMISDGASWNTWEMGAEWQAGVSANALPAYADMDVRLGMTTYPLTTSSSPTNDANGDGLSYDADKAWDESAAEVDESDSYQTAIAGYQYLKSNFTDSAAAGTALSTGQKTYNNAINYDNLGQPLHHPVGQGRGQDHRRGDHGTAFPCHAGHLRRPEYQPQEHDRHRPGHADQRQRGSADGHRQPGLRRQRQRHECPE